MSIKRFVNTFIDVKLYVCVCLQSDSDQHDVQHVVQHGQ